jgi:predicted small integral membrane protein
MTIRLSKLLLVLSMAFLASLVSFGNITDYGSNLEFVHHVFLMDTTFPGNANMYRAIASAAIQNAGYVLIIALETLTAGLCWVGAVSCGARGDLLPLSSGARHVSRWPD